MPTPGAIANRRLLIYLVVAAGIVGFLYAGFFGRRGAAAGGGGPIAYKNSNTPIHHVDVGAETLRGDVVMGKLGNETLKAELGRASWKLFHTTMARFPEKPTEDEQTALFSYIHLFARLYPCGECASHFRQILAEFPPQVSSRNAAAGWACHVHNEVNASLKKPRFDCTKIGDFYDCGCEKEEGEGGEKDEKKKKGSGVTREGGMAVAAVAGDENPNALALTSTSAGGDLVLKKEAKTLGG